MRQSADARELSGESRRNQDMMTEKILTKSRFICGYDCPQRLVYAAQGCASTQEDDDFLRLLAEGGFQFEKIVRHRYPDARTIGGGLRTAVEGTAQSIQEIRTCISAGGGVINEAPFLHGGLFARADMLRVTSSGIDLLEIKTKSFDGPIDGRAEVDSRFEGLNSGKVIYTNKDKIRSGWRDYIADVAFQLIVVRRALAASGLGGMKVRPLLVLVNSNSRAQEFDTFENLRVDVKEGSKDGSSRRDVKVEFIRSPPKGFRSAIPIEVDVTDAVELLCENAASKAVRWDGMRLEMMIDDAAALLHTDTKPNLAELERGWKCKKCEYRADPSDGTQSGLKQCWGEDAARIAERLFDIHYGHLYNPSDHQIEGKGGAWFRRAVDQCVPLRIRGVGDLPEDAGEGKLAVRRNRQIDATREGRTKFSSTFLDEAREILFPPNADGVAHFLDFENALAAVPYFSGGRPYEVAPFQFSLHSVPVKNGSPQWKDASHRAWLFDAKATGPRIVSDDRRFLVALRDELLDASGFLGSADDPIFHWSKHEHTVLRKMYSRIAADDQRDELLEFIDSIAPESGEGGRLRDLLTFTGSHVFHPLQRGRFSIKAFLPAICSEATGRRVIKDLMGAECFVANAPLGELWDPYGSLPMLNLPEIEGIVARIQGESEETEDFEDAAVACGTDAIRAYQALRFGGPNIDSEKLRRQLLDYCKLDTAAMVAAWAWLLEAAKLDPTQRAT